MVVNTPSRKRQIKRIVKKLYCAVASSAMSSPIQSRQIIRQVGSKIKAEMKDLSSFTHDSILNNSREAVKWFSWETIRLEFESKMPTLMSLLSEITTISLGVHAPLLSFVASLLLKCKHRQLCLVQRAISVMLYGYGTAKQVGTNSMKYYYVCTNNGHYMSPGVFKSTATSCLSESSRCYECGQ